MMKRIMCILLVALLSITLVACGDSSEHIGEARTPSGSSVMKGETTDTSNSNTETENDVVSGKIEMPNSSVSYEGAQWTLESLTKHFKELGFTSFENIPCDPDEDNYRSNIFVIEICTGWFSEDPWEAGEKFNSDDTIKIYYNEFPLLTIDNCPDLLTMLTSDEMSYMTFANKYDGRYVEFDGYVHSHTTYNAGIDRIINVAGGDYTENGAPGHIIRIGDRTWGNNINESVEEGDPVTISGKIDASWCEYYKMLYVETLSLSRR